MPSNSINQGAAGGIIVQPTWGTIEASGSGKAVDIFDAILSEMRVYLDAKADKKDVYNKTETYSKTETNTLLSNKVTKTGDTMTGRLTANGKISLATDGGSWISQKDTDKACIKITTEAALNDARYDSIIGGKSTDGSSWNMGVMNNSIYFGRYAADQTENSFTNYVRIDLINGYVNKAFNVAGTVAIANGGTGATTAADARTNLGITPANIGAAASSHTHSYLPLSGGTLTNTLNIFPASGTIPYLITKRADVGLGDTVSSYVVFNYLQFRDKNNRTTGQISTIYGPSKENRIRILGGNVADGADKTNYLDIGVYADGTKFVDMSNKEAWRNALGLGNTTGAVPVANGGTGATTAAGARTNLGAMATRPNAIEFLPSSTTAGHGGYLDFHYNGETSSDYTSRIIEGVDRLRIQGKKLALDAGALEIAFGGTDATTRLGALRNLTNQSVGTDAEYFLTITTNWVKGGYTSVGQAKTVLGLKSAAYTESSDYLKLSGGTMTGTIKGKSTQSSWIYSRNNAGLCTDFTNNGYYFPCISFKSKSGEWSLGAYPQSDLACFSYTTDANYSAGTNASKRILFTVPSANDLYCVEATWGTGAMTDGSSALATNTFYFQY